jgi:hypothetical protein
MRILREHDPTSRPSDKWCWMKETRKVVLQVEEDSGDEYKSTILIQLDTLAS